MPNLNTIDPRTLPGLLAWYSAKWVNGFGGADPVDAATIAQWNDLSPAARHLVQATEANKPTFRKQALGSFPAVRFADATDLMSNVLAGAKPRPITVVGLWKNSLADDALLHKAVTFNAARLGLGIDWLTNNAFVTIDDAVVGGVLDAGSTGNWFLTSVTFRPAGESNFVSRGGSNGRYAGVTGTNTDSSIDVGSFAMDVAEVMVFDRALDPTMHHAMQRALAFDWALPTLYRNQIQ